MPMEEHKKVILAGVVFIVLVVLAAALYYFVFYEREGRSAEEEVTPQQALVETEPVGEKKEDMEFLDVNLEDSDELVRQKAAGLSSHPSLSRWLQGDDLIRRFVAAVDNIANGQSPAPQIDFFKPQGRFRVVERDGRYYIDPESYHRYDLVAESFDSLDVRECVKLYRQLTPVLEEAYRDLGYPGGGFHSTLLRAIRELLRVPSVMDIQVEKRVITYAMVDPELERLSPAQKHLLRMGPDNVRKIQAKLEAMASALGMEK